MILRLIFNYLILHILQIVICIYAQNNPEEPLFLTPYINSGQIIEAKRVASVHNLSSTVESYSGLITVDEENGTHTFFWFFPAANNPESAPILLWSEGGPGITGFYSIFLEHGPFLIGVNGDLQHRDITWTQNHSIIYTDQPMDVGFSFTEQGNVSSAAECAPKMYNFLMQFFKLFPEFQNNDFYTSGVSYGGIYAPEIANYIHTKNNDNPEIRINLKGILLETPWVDPGSQMEFGDYLYNVGLINDSARDYFKYEEEKIKELISAEDYLASQDIFDDLLFGKEFGTYFSNITGHTTYYNILKDQPAESDESWIPIVCNSTNFRKAIHVGNLTFTPHSAIVKQLFRPNLMKGVKPIVENLLDFGYKILMYAGQLDIITSHIGVDKMIRNLVWDGAGELGNASRNIWRVDGKVAGYVKSARNFTHVVMTNAGHGSAEDQPIRAFDLLNRFTGNVPFY